VTKYIGETEEPLKRIFDKAEHSDAILFFDEADVLFGESSEVSDSHDRYASIEVSYLFRRMEEHDGAVILTTNLGENIEDAYGGDIKNVALTAAFLAVDEGSSVAMRHVVRALRRELQKTGRLVDPESFGEYSTMLGK
jgi:ATP-dependent 26S proteasome regulatory subunit